MIMVTGGIASGKKTYLERCGVSLASIFDARDEARSTASLSDASVVLHVEELVRLGEISEETLALLLKKQALTCTEVGSGIIPLEREERQFRERAGSLSTALAREASRVVRMVCGIPLTLKGDVPTGE